MRRVSEPRKEEVEGTKKGSKRRSQAVSEGWRDGCEYRRDLGLGVEGWEVGNESVCTSASR